MLCTGNDQKGKKQQAKVVVGSKKGVPRSFTPDMLCAEKYGGDFKATAGGTKLEEEGLTWWYEKQRKEDVIVVDTVTYFRYSTG